MPLYEYECTICHRRTEKIQKFSDAELTICPFCGGPLERTLTAPAVHFAGGGWYKDLYSSAKPPAAASAGEGKGDSGASSASDTPAAAPSGSSSEGSSAPAPAATPAAAPSVSSAPPPSAPKSGS